MFLDDKLQLIAQRNTLCVTKSALQVVVLYVILDFTRDVITVKESHSVPPALYPFFCCKEVKTTY